MDLHDPATANSSLGLARLGPRSLRVSGGSLKLGREAGRYQQGMLALWMLYLSLPNPQDLYRAVHIKCTLQAGKASLKCKLRANTLQSKASTGGHWMSVQVQTIISGFRLDLLSNRLCGGPGDATGSLPKKNPNKTTQNQKTLLPFS